MSSREMGSVTPTSESGQCRLQARPSNEANGMITPSRRRAARVNFGRPSATAPAAARVASSNAAARRAPVRIIPPDSSGILLVEYFAAFLQGAVAREGLAEEADGELRVEIAREAGDQEQLKAARAAAQLMAELG